VEQELPGKVMLVAHLVAVALLFRAVAVAVQVPQEQWELQAVKVAQALQVVLLVHL